jgi:hypothetical protein
MQAGYRHQVANPGGRVTLPLLTRNKVSPAHTDGHQHGSSIILGQMFTDSCNETLTQSGYPIDRSIIASKILRSVYDVTRGTDALAKKPTLVVKAAGI